MATVSELGLQEVGLGAVRRQGQLSNWKLNKSKANGFESLTDKKATVPQRGVDGGIL